MDAFAGKPVNEESGLAEVERDERPTWLLTWPEVKLLGIAGTGFLLDAYDLFVINQVMPMLKLRYFHDPAHPLDPALQDFVKAGANVGCVIGQLLFGYLADSLGRKAVYGKEMLVIIFATILTISVPSYLNPTGVMVWLGVFRIVLGVGIGGDYPMSSTITSDRASIQRRGVLLTFIFANQGWGSLLASLITMIVLGGFKSSIEHDVNNIDKAWRVIIGLSLVAALSVVYQRLTLPESSKFKQSQQMQAEGDDAVKKGTVLGVPEEKDEKELQQAAELAEKDREAEELKQKEVELGARPSHANEFVTYFSEWRHARVLIGTAGTWFLIDIALYGINLNQSVVLETIGFAGKNGSEWQKLFDIATGNLIITALGFLPGYYVTLFFIEKLGRKWIMIQGFLMNALFLGILAGRFHSLSKVPFVVLFAFLQFFFNFGANTITYVIAAESFPTRVRASAHGISAACGKCGAILAAFAFNTLTSKIGTDGVLWIFLGVSFLGAAMSFLVNETTGVDPDVRDAQERQAALLAREQAVAAQ